MQQSRSERVALGVCAGIAALALCWVARPLGVGLLLGTLIAFMFEPLRDWLALKLRRPTLARGVCVATAALAIVALVFGLSFLLIERGVVLAGGFVQELQPNGAIRVRAEHLGARLAPYGVDFDWLADKLREAVTSIAAITAAVAARTFSLLLTLFFALLTMAFVLRESPAIERVLDSTAPLAPEHTRALVREFRRVGRVTLLGNLVTGVGQGLLGGVIYWICGVPEPAFFGALTAVASLVPVIGTSLVWFPAGLYLLATGHVASGIVAWVAAALLIVGGCDYVLRPRLLGGESTPALLMLIALFGGVETFGLVGLLVGPLIVTVAAAVLRIYVATRLAK